MVDAGAGGERPRPELTLQALRDWEDSGASWRGVEVSDQRVVVELCTCLGEPVDRLSGTEPGLIDFVRSRPRSEL